MTYRLPPLNALRAFEAAARHLSFRNAAGELHVTPGAVSQQVRSLEATLGVDLFERVHNGLVLTAAGQRYVAPLRRAFATISVATESVVGRPAEITLTIATDPDFAIHWLVPRTAAFHQRHPEFRVRVVAETSREAEQAQIRILADTSHLPDMRGEPVVRESLMPAGSPARIDPRANDGLPMLRDTPRIGAGDAALWRQWAASQDPPVDLAAGSAARSVGEAHAYDDRALAVHAAEIGKGLILASTISESDSLETGRLIPLPGLRPLEHTIWYAHLPPGRMDCAEERTVLDWLGQA